MTLRTACLFLLFFSTSLTAMAQEKNVNGYRNRVSDGLSDDTNVSFTLRMTLAGEDIPRGSASLGQNVSISTIIRPEAEDIGMPADIIIVDFVPPFNLKMRNLDGNFVNWDGKLPNLIPSLEAVTLQDALEVEIFSGQLGSAGDHRIFTAFLVDDALYFTPSALRIDITEAVQTARDQAIALFDSTISPEIVQVKCIVCHVSGGAADGESQQIFTRTSNSDHLSINFQELEDLHASRGSTFILEKARGMQNHGGSVQITNGSNDFNNLSDFLDLLDQATSE